MSHGDMEAEDLVGRVGVEALLDGLPIGITCVDARTRRITYRNLAARTIAEKMGMPYDGTDTAAYMGFLWPDGRPLAPDEIPGVASIERGSGRKGYVSSRPAWQGGTMLLTMNTAPLRDEGGSIVGALLAFREVESFESERHPSELRRQFEVVDRRSRLLAILGEAVREYDEPTALVEMGARILGVQLQADRCNYLTVNPEAGTFRLFEGYSSGLPGKAGVYRLSRLGKDLTARMNGGQSVVIADTSSDPLTRDAYDAFYAPLGLRATIAVSLVRGGRWVALFAVGVEKPREWRVDEVRLVEEVAERLWSAIERIEHQRALATSEARFRALVEEIPELTWTALPDGTRDYHSPQWLAFTGRSAEESLDGRWQEAIHPEDREPFLTAWRSAVGQAVPFGATFRLRRHDGDFRYFQARARPVRDADGTIVRWMGASTDVHDVLTARQESERRAERQRRVAESAYRITHAKSADEALRVATEETRATLGARAVLVRLQNDEGGLANWSGSLGNGRFLWTTVSARPSVERRLAHIAGFQAIQIDLTDPTLREKLESLGLEDLVREPSTALIAPLLDQEGTRIGLMILCPDDQPCGPEEESVLEQYAQLLTSAILNARLTEGLILKAAELRRASRETFDRLARAAALRDEDTAEHTGRVGRLSADIALTLGLPWDDAARLGRAAELHDIGKIGVPDAILRKPSPLTADERAEMEAHAHLGAELLDGCEDPVLKEATVIAYCHHERWDGKGYPRGLAGDGIPLPGRIVAVADAFDAMTENRPYRQGMEVTAACARLKAGRGAQWDPQVVDALLHHLAISGARDVA